MLKTKIVSSQQKAFIDDKIDAFPTLDKISVLRGERLSVQLLYVDEAVYSLVRCCGVSFE